MSDATFMCRCEHIEDEHKKRNIPDGAKPILFNTDDLLPECQRCPDHVDKAQGDFDKGKAARGDAGYEHNDCDAGH